jgi:hypothetical protein
VSRVITPSSTGIGKKYIVHPFVSYGAGGTAFQGNAVTPQINAINFSFNGISNFANLALVYDQYRIDKVEVTFMLRNPGAALSSFPRLHVFPDFDDSNVPSTLGFVLAHPRVSHHTFNSSSPEYSLALSPRPGFSAYNGTFSAFGQMGNPVFMDVNQPSAQHYGLKWAIENFTDTTQFIDVFVKTWFTMRNPL